jgi:pyroglutamyl-peptidase
MTVAARTKVLLTGFGPFPGVPENATMILVPALAARARQAFPDIRCETAILPTEWNAAPDILRALVSEHDPDLALHFGVSARASGLELERVGYNACSGADAAGFAPATPRLNADGPAALSVDVPIGLAVERLRRRGIAAEPSRDAGRYLCNALIYHSITAGRGAGRAMRSAFVHIPASLPVPGMRRRGLYRVSRLDWHAAVDGGLIILSTCLGRPLPAASLRARGRR